MLTARVFHREGAWWYAFVEGAPWQGPALEASHAARNADEEPPPDAATTPD